MPRALALGNGNMLVNIDKDAHLRDFYFPYVGLEDHTTYGHYHRVGLYEEGRGLTWLKDDHWRSKVAYLPETLVGDIDMISDEWGICIKFNDFVDPTSNVFVRKITVENRTDQERQLKLFFNFDFHLYGTKVNDTVYYDASLNALINYKLSRYLLINAECDDGHGMDQYTTGKSEYNGLEGTWRDAEDGMLSCHPIEQGSTDCTFGKNIMLAPKSHKVLFTWVCAGTNLNEVKNINEYVKETGLAKIFRDSQNYWYKWVNKQEFNFEGVPHSFVNLFKRSLLTVRSQIDKGGAIIAANDTDIMKFNKDTYSYMWPRDGALVALSLDNAGYSEVTSRFFEFCCKALGDHNFLQHKYNPDGSLGSSWHPAVYKGQPQNPLQEDETALPLIAIWNHYERYRDIEFLHKMYHDFVRRTANFLCEYRHKGTGLPKASYDLWEEQKGVFTWTSAATYGGLIAAHKICEALGHFTHSKRYRDTAEEIKNSIMHYLWSEEHQRFLKKVYLHQDSTIEEDLTIDASSSAIFLFELLKPDDPRVASNMQQIKENLWVNTQIGGIARYQNDYYHFDGTTSKDVPGNPWIITTLWYAKWLLLAAKGVEDPKYSEATDLMNWATEKATSSGILAEQYNPYSGQPLSVAPLTWSHSTYVDVIMTLRQRLTDWGICKECLIPRYN